MEMRKCGNGGVGLLGELGEARRDAENLWGEVARKINIRRNITIRMQSEKKRKKT